MVETIYPWVRLLLDLKELLISFDRHLITCLIANQVQGNATPHPCTVLSSFLHHLAQLILLIIALPGTDDAPPFLHHPEIYGIEFWHAHLNYACTRFAASHDSDGQICHWTTGTSETCLKLPTSWFFCRRPLAPTFSLNTVPRCLPLSAPLTMYPCKMNRTLSGSTRAPSQPLLP